MTLTSTLSVLVVQDAGPNKGRLGSITRTFCDGTCVPHKDFVLCFGSGASVVLDLFGHLLRFVEQTAGGVFVFRVPRDRETIIAEYAECSGAQHIAIVDAVDLCISCGLVDNQPGVRNGRRGNVLPLEENDSHVCVRISTEN